MPVPRAAKRLDAVAQAVDEIACAELAALADRAPGARAPALGDILAGEVHHRVAPGEGVRGRRFAQRVPAHRWYAQPRGGAGGVAREHRHLGAVRH
jgi:hypothetical protein